MGSVSREKFVGDGNQSDCTTDANNCVPNWSFGRRRFEDQGARNFEGSRSENLLVLNNVRAFYHYFFLNKSKIFLLFFEKRSEILYFYFCKNKTIFEKKKKKKFITNSQFLLHEIQKVFSFVL